MISRTLRLDWTNGSNVFISQFLRRRPIAFSGGSEMTVACSVQWMFSCSAMKSAMEARSRTRSRCGLSRPLRRPAKHARPCGRVSADAATVSASSPSSSRSDSKMHAVCSTPLPSSSTSRSRKFVSAASKYASPMLRPPMMANVASAIHALLCIRRVMTTRRGTSSNQRNRRLPLALLGLNSRSEMFGWLSNAR